MLNQQDKDGSEVVKVGGFVLKLTTKTTE